MANRFDQAPQISFRQRPSTYVPQEFIGIPLEYIAGSLDKRQKEFDEAETGMTASLAAMKPFGLQDVEAYGQKMQVDDRSYVENKIKDYRTKEAEIIDALSKGDYTAVKKARKLGSDYQSDQTLANIRERENIYNNWLKLKTGAKTPYEAERIDSAIRDLALQKSNFNYLPTTAPTVLSDFNETEMVNQTIAHIKENVYGNTTEKASLSQEKVTAMLNDPNAKITYSEKDGMKVTDGTTTISVKPERVRDIAMNMLNGNKTFQAHAENWVNYELGRKGIFQGSPEYADAYYKMKEKYALNLIQASVGKASFTNYQELHKEDNSDAIALMAMQSKPSRRGGGGGGSEDEGNNQLTSRYDFLSEDANDSGTEPLKYNKSVINTFDDLVANIQKTGELAPKNQGTQRAFAYGLILDAYSAEKDNKNLKTLIKQNYNSLINTPIAVSTEVDGKMHVDPNLKTNPIKSIDKLIDIYSSKPSIKAAFHMYAIDKNVNTLQAVLKSELKSEDQKYINDLTSATFTKAINPVIESKNKDVSKAFETDKYNYSATKYSAVENSTTDKFFKAIGKQLGLDPDLGTPTILIDPTTGNLQVSQQYTDKDNKKKYTTKTIEMNDAKLLKSTLNNLQQIVDKNPGAAEELNDLAGQMIFGSKSTSLGDIFSLEGHNYQGGTISNKIVSLKKGESTSMNFNMYGGKQFMGTITKVSGNNYNINTNNGANYTNLPLDKVLGVLYENLPREVHAQLMKELELAK